MTLRTFILTAFAALVATTFFYKYHNGFSTET